MESGKLKEKLANFLKEDMPAVGDICAIWMAGVVAYASCIYMEPFFTEGWYDFHFLTFASIPPQKHEWRVKHSHLTGDEFLLNSNPACILALNLCDINDDPNVIKSQSWEDMINGTRKEDDEGGGGCPSQCDTPCS